MNKIQFQSRIYVKLIVFYLSIFHKKYQIKYTILTEGKVPGWWDIVFLIK